MARTRLTPFLILIAVAAFTVGCSMDSIAPMAPDTTTPQISAKPTKKTSTTTDTSVPYETTSTTDETTSTTDATTETTDNTASTETESSTTTADYEAMYGYPFPPVYFSNTIPANKRSASAYITVADGGEIVVQSGQTAVKLVFPPNSVPYDQTMTLTLVNGYAVDVEIKPSMVLNEPATLIIDGKLAMEGGSTNFDLYHHAEQEEAWDNDSAAYHEGDGEVIYYLEGMTFSLEHFSRYAFGSRF